MLASGLAVWICYVVILAPVLGVAQSGPQLVSDRYSYLSYLGWVILVGAGSFHYWRAWMAQVHRRLAFYAAGLAGMVVVGLGELTRKQTHIWHDSGTLWRHVLAENPVSRAGHNSLGVWLGDHGKIEEAIHHYHEAIRIDPRHVKAYYNLGDALKSQGKVEKAIGQYRLALNIDPSDSMAHNNLGIALAGQGRIEDATRHFLEALRIDPTNASVHANLANVFAGEGEVERAIKHYRRALQMKPEFAPVHERLGRLLTKQGKRDEAIHHLEEALRIMKSDPPSISSQD